MSVFVKEKSFYKDVLKISIPIAMQGLINVGVSMTDTMMLGSFGGDNTISSILSESILFYIFNY